MANKERSLAWTEIDTEDSDEADQEFKLNLNKDLEENPNKDEQQKSQDSRRGILTVSPTQKQKNAEARAEVEEDQDEGSQREESPGLNQEESEDSPKRSGRAHKRIKTLLGRLSEKDQYIAQLESKVRQVGTQARVTEKNSVLAQKAAWEQIIKDKEAALEEAADKANGKDVARLSRELAEATLKHQAFSAVADDFEGETEEPEVQRGQQRLPTRADVPEAAKEWVERNPWFKSDAKKHAVARMISQELTNEGELDPHDDDYWKELDTRMGKFLGIKEIPEETRKKRGSPVGSRSDEDSESTSRVNEQFTRTGNRVQATPSASDKDMAERLGVDIKGYMKEKYKYAQQDFKGYVPIDIPGQ